MRPYNHWTRRFQRWRGGTWTRYGDECINCGKEEGKTIDSRELPWCDKCVVGCPSPSIPQWSFSKTVSFPVKVKRKYIARGIGLTFPTMLGLWILYQDITALSVKDFMNHATVPQTFCAIFTIAIMAVLAIGGIMATIEWIANNWDG